MIDEPVHVVQYDQRWPAEFAVERDRLANCLHVRADRIEHIGSTAVPWLSAKPIIDMMLGVSRYPPMFQLVEDITALGYESLGEAGVSGRLYFRRRDSCSFNLHVLEFGGGHWMSNLALRDYLRADGEARERYVAAKLSALESGAKHLLAYSEAKSSTVVRLLSEAEAFQVNKAVEPTR